MRNLPENQSLIHQSAISQNHIHSTGKDRAHTIPRKHTFGENHPFG